MRSRGICFRRSRTYHDDCFSKSLYPPQARFIVTLPLLPPPPLAVHTFYYHSHSVDDPAAGFANGFLCDITKRGISARYSLSLSLFLFVSFYVAASVVLNRGFVEIVAICYPSSFLHSNASLFGRKINFSNLSSLDSRSFSYSARIRDSCDLRTFH